jgi:MFS family permease
LQAATFLVLAGFGSVYAVLALYVGSLGASAAIAGLVIGCVGATRLVCNIPAGIGSERLGRRRTMIAGLLLLAVGSVAAFWASSVVSLLLVLMLQSVGSAAYTTAALSATVDLGTPASRVRDLAAYQGANQIGLSVGPALGGLLAAGAGYLAPFLLQAALAIIALLIILPVPETQVRAPAPARAANHDLLGTVMLVAAPASLILGIMISRVASYWLLIPLFAQAHFAMSASGIGILLTAGAVANVAVLPFASRLTRRFGQGPVVIVAAGLVLGALGLLADLHGAAGLWTASVLLGAAPGLAVPVLTAMASVSAPAGRIGLVMGLMRSMTDLSVLIGPTLCGVAMDAFNHSEGAPVGLCGVVLLAAMIGFVLPQLNRAAPELARSPHETPIPTRRHP